MYLSLSISIFLPPSLFLLFSMSLCVCVSLSLSLQGRRNPTGRLLGELFESCGAAYFLALLEALRDGRPLLHTRALPEEPETQGALLELFSAGISILSGEQWRPVVMGVGFDSQPGRFWVPLLNICGLTFRPPWTNWSKSKWKDAGNLRHYGLLCLLIDVIVLLKSKVKISFIVNYFTCRHTKQSRRHFSLSHGEQIK